MFDLAGRTPILPAKAALSIVKSIVRNQVLNNEPMEFHVSFRPEMPPIRVTLPFLCNVIFAAPLQFRAVYLCGDEPSTEVLMLQVLPTDYICFNEKTMPVNPGGLALEMSLDDNTLRSPLETYTLP
jgi:hypothetical protein